MGKFNINWSKIGEEAIDSTINGVYTLLSNWQSAALQHKYWQKQALESFKLGETSADNALKRQYQLYNDLQSPSAIVAQLKEAGLNPALMYSQGGMGGSVNSAPQSNNTQNILGVQTHGLQKIVDPLTRAQIENIDADTAKKKEEAENLKVKTATERFNTLIAQWKSKQEEQNYTFSKEEHEVEMKKAWEEYNLLIENVESAVRQNEIGEETKDATIKKAWQELTNLEWDGTLKEIESRKMEEEIKNLKADTNKKYSETDLNKIAQDKVRGEIDKLAVETNKLEEEIIKTIQETESEQALEDLRRKKIEEIENKYDWDKFTKQDLKDAINMTIDAYKAYNTGKIGNKKSGIGKAVKKIAGKAAKSVATAVITKKA